jgi:hypothetical protein
MHSKGTGTLLTGTARSLGFLSAGLSSSGIGFISNLTTSLQGQSIFAQEPFGGWHTRPPIVGSSALIWLLAFDE